MADPIPTIFDFLAHRELVSKLTNLQDEVFRSDLSLDSKDMLHRLIGHFMFYSKCIVKVYEPEQKSE